MESMISKFHGYIIFFLLIAFSSFEFFFRSTFCNNLLLLYCIFLYLLISRKNLPKIKSLVFIVSLFFLFIIQDWYNHAFEVVYCINRIFLILGLLIFSLLIGKSYIRIFTNIVVFIACYSSIIYFLSFVPQIETFFFYLSSKIHSLNAENAVQEGAGVNFIIYNFQYNREYLGIFNHIRNCGPFWEPGMFAVFINMALYFSIFIYRNIKYFIVLLISLITTFSTGGYFCCLSIILIYVYIKSKNIPILVLGTIGIIFLFYYFQDQSFLFSKLLSQISSSHVGDDVSRFSAIITQCEMISKSPIVGGLNISDFTSTKTLASGILMPFVQYGIICGSFYFLLLYRACDNWLSFFVSKRIYSITFFFLLLELSISQTILTSPIILTFLFDGINLLKKNNIRHFNSIRNIGFHTS